MGALNGALSYLRFLVDGEPAKNPGTTYERAIEARRFMPLAPSGDVMESAGWVPLEAPFDDELAITRDLFLFGDLVCVTYREDKYAIPRALLQRETQKRLDKIAKDEKKSREEMSRAFIKAVEGAVLQELKSRTIPRSKLVDVVWDMSKKEARVFGRGTIATERVSSLIERTFQVRVDVGTYAARAFGLDIGSRNLSVLERLSPGWLFPDAIQRDPSEPGAGDEDALET
jgi:hypothetical protein